jgi:hypothetical protein
MGVVGSGWRAELSSHCTTATTCHDVLRTCRRLCASNMGRVLTATSRMVGRWSALTQTPDAPAPRADTCTRLEALAPLPARALTLGLGLGVGLGLGFGVRGLGLRSFLMGALKTRTSFGSVRVFVEIRPYGPKTRTRTDLESVLPLFSTDPPSKSVENRFAPISLAPALR